MICYFGLVHIHIPHSTGTYCQTVACYQSVETSGLLPSLIKAIGPHKDEASSLYRSVSCEHFYIYYGQQAIPPSRTVVARTALPHFRSAIVPGFSWPTGFFFPHE